MSGRASRRPSHSDAVVLACDAGHLPLALCVALRIAETEPARRFDLVVATPDWSAIPAAWHDLPVRFVELEVGRIPTLRQDKSWISAAALYRMILPDALGPDYATLLYLDTDTYLRRPGLDGLFAAAAAQDAALAACPDRLHLKPPRKLARPAERALLDDLGGAGRRYFQSGVLLMRTRPFRRADLSERMLTVVAERADMLARHGYGSLGDQGAINAAASDLIVPLSPLWNWSGRTWLRPGALRWFDPRILHFTGPNKPWAPREAGAAADLHPDYLARLRRHAPEAGITARAEAAPPPARRPLREVSDRWHALEQGPQMQRLIATAQIG